MSINNATQELTAGVDEAGRGPLAGPVAAAAVILPDHHNIDGIDDSKKLTHKRRVELAIEIKAQAISWSIVCAEADEIDRLNILHATMAAMARALYALDVQPSGALIDGNRCPPLHAGFDVPMTAVIGGDGVHACIGAASILAKVHRDQLMVNYHEQFPQYGFDRHKGYPTAQHLNALKVHGPSILHRQSFRPVRESMALKNITVSPHG